MKFPIIEFPSDMFHFGADNVGSAEASTMGNRHMQRLYDDAMDLGFNVRSTKTDKVVTYVYEKTKYTEGDEPEIASWEFTPSNESMRDIPECRGSKIIVWND